MNLISHSFFSKVGGIKLSDYYSFPLQSLQEMLHWEASLTTFIKKMQHFFDLPSFEMCSV